MSQMIFACELHGCRVGEYWIKRLEAFGKTYRVCPDCYEKYHNVPEYVLAVTEGMTFWSFFHNWITTQKAAGMSEQDARKLETYAAGAWATGSEIGWVQWTHRITDDWRKALIVYVRALYEPERISEGVELFDVIFRDKPFAWKPQQRGQVFDVIKNREVVGRIYTSHHSRFSAGKKKWCASCDEDAGWDQQSFDLREEALQHLLDSCAKVTLLY